MGSSSTRSRALLSAVFAAPPGLLTTGIHIEREACGRRGGESVMLWCSACRIVCAASALWSAPAGPVRSRKQSHGTPPTRRAPPYPPEQQKTSGHGLCDLRFF